jgi:hypothetical protein
MSDLPRRVAPSVLNYSITTFHDAVAPKITISNVPRVADLLRRAAKHVLENAGDEPQAQEDSEFLRELADRLLDARDRILKIQSNRNA